MIAPPGVPRRSSLSDSPPILPLRVAAQVAWNSLRVRLARSLVTMSSVVLAVAFLFSVVGEHLVNHAVYASAQAKGRPAEWVQNLRDALDHPRGTLALLALLAHHTDEIASWQLRMSGQPLARLNPAVTLLSETLVIWVQALKPTQTYLITRNQAVTDWLLSCDHAEAMTALASTARTFKGVRLPFSPEELASIAAHMPTLRTAIAQLHATEQLRLKIVSEAGGVDAVLRQLHSSDDTGAAGLPVIQVMPGANVDDLKALRDQLRIDLVRSRAIQALAELNRDELTAGQPASPTPTASPTPPSPLPHRHAANAYDLPMIADPARLADPANGAARRQLIARIGEVALDQLADNLRRRADVAAVAQTFTGMAYDPEAGRTRTFWLVTLSLLVCVVGIVNAMMMAVSERFREIATMKCLGATDAFILKAFLIEAGAMGVVGSLLGLGLGLVLVISQGVWRFDGAFWAALPIGDLLTAGSTSLICGLALAVLGALLPALKAARMPPVEAMRVEA